MKKLDPKDRVVVLIAKMHFKLGLTLLFFGLLLVINQFWPDTIFSEYKSENISTSPAIQSSEYVYIPIAFDPADVKDGIHIPTGMIADTGCAEVIQNCGACHSLELVKQNKATKEGWKEKIVWMQQTQKLWDLGLQEEVILNYLAKNYGPQNTGRRKNLENIEWYKL